MTSIVDYILIIFVCLQYIFICFLVFYKNIFTPIKYLNWIILIIFFLLNWYTITNNENPSTIFFIVMIFSAIANPVSSYVNAINCSQ